MVTFFNQLKMKLAKFLIPDNSVTDSQVLEHLLSHTQVIVWTADMNHNLLTIKGSLPSSESDTQSIEFELRSRLQTEAEQLSHIETDKLIVLKHQLNNLPVETHIKPLYDNDQQMIGIMGITNLYIAETESADKHEPAAQALGKFLEAASHDLRTPLSVINTSIYLLEKSHDESKRATRIQLLKDTIGRLQLILDSMFLMARVDATPPYVSNPIQLGIVLHNILIEYHDIADTKNIKLQLQQLDILPSIQGHEAQLQTAISNVIENAIQNTESGGTVQICASIDNSTAIIKVIDNGKGISEKDLPHVFERFYRVDKFRPTEDTRIGLGLSIANTVIEKHNGQITIDSDLGKGTTVVMALPT